ncbi:Hsp20/alpha crystallin family protein [Desulfothermus okinawensis JCM 13304]
MLGLRFLPALRKENDVAKTESIFDLMENLWRDPFNFSLFRDVTYPAVNISENEKEVKVRAELPGLDPKDVELTIQNNTLILKGEKKLEEEEKKDNFHRIECSYGSFYRSIPLPTEIDESKVSAKFKNGVLEIRLPKKEEARGKKIPIES